MQWPTACSKQYLSAVQRIKQYKPQILTLDCNSCQQICPLQVLSVPVYQRDHQNLSSSPPTNLPVNRKQRIFIKTSKTHISLEHVYDITIQLNLRNCVGDKLIIPAKIMVSQLFGKKMHEKSNFHSCVNWLEVKLQEAVLNHTMKNVGYVYWQLCWARNSRHALEIHTHL